MNLLARTPLTVAAATAACCALAAPAALAAKQPLEDSLSLKASHGYSISVEGTPNQGSPASVSLTASRKHGNATYSTSGTATRKTLKAKFGGLGSMKLRFHLKHKKRIKRLAGCSGKKVAEELGTWKGKLKFRGEGGYTSVRVSKAKGRILPPRKWKCHFGSSKHLTTLEAFEPTGIGPAPLSFNATKRDGKSKASFVATKVEFPLGGATMSVMRGAFVSAPAKSRFTFDSGLTHATVKPPGPFSGTGSYSNGAWSGSLSANFPGAGNVSLTGGDWQASLTHG